MKLLVLIAIVFCFITCTKEEDPVRQFPVVITREVSNILNASATFSGDILSVSSGVVDYGFVWTRVGFPTLANVNALKQSFGAKAERGTFEFTTPGNLQPGKTYDMCAYVRSDQRIVYGKTYVFVSK